CIDYDCRSHQYQTSRSDQNIHSFPTRRSSDLDRHFMNRLVDHLFVLDGKGNVKDYIGDYEDYRQALKEEKSAEKVEKVAAVAAADRKSTRLNSSHVKISYAVFCLKKKMSYHTD